MSYIGRSPTPGEVIILNSIESQFNGSLTTFNLTRTTGGVTSNFYPVSSGHLLVSLGGVIQKPDSTGNTGFRINYNTIIFAVAPLVNTSCFIISYGNIVDVGTPADLTVTPIKLSTGGPSWDTSGNLTVAGNLTVNGSTTTINSTTLSIDDKNIVIADGVSTLANLDTAGIDFGSTNVRLRYNYNGGTNSGLSIEGTNVGIGTTNPTGILNLRGYSGGTVGSAVSAYNKTFVIGGEYNQSYNTGNSVLMHITDYSNDAGDDVYPIYCEDENNILDFFINAGNSQSTSTKKAYFGGNVGIGITNPSAKLHVSGTGGNQIAISDTGSTGGSIKITNTSTGATAADGFVLGYDGSNNIEIRNYENTDIIFFTGNTERVRINSSGNVGIGTTNPDRKFVVSGAGSNGTEVTKVTSTSNLNSGGYHWLTSGLAPNEANAHIINIIGNALSAKNSGYFGFRYQGAGSNSNYITIGGFGVDNIITATMAANVGIGTNNPSHRLQVNGSAAKTSADGNPVAFSSNDAANAFQLVFQRSASTDSVPVWSISSVEQSVAYRTLSLQPNGGNTIIGMGGGNVGIGTNNPEVKLHVQGNSWVNNNSGDTQTRAQGLTVSTAPSSNFTAGSDPGDELRNTSFICKGASRAAIISLRNLDDIQAFYDLVADGNTDSFYIQKASSPTLPAFRIDSSGRVTMPYQPAFHAYQTGGAAVNAPGIFSSTQWNATLVNTGSHFNTSNGRFTAPVAGVYMFQIKGLARHVSAAGNVEISLYKNGANATTRSFGYSQMIAPNDHATITAIVYLSLAVNDYVQMGVHALAAGTDLYYGENLGSFCGHLIG